MEDPPAVNWADSKNTIIILIKIILQYGTSSKLHKYEHAFCYNFILQHDSPLEIYILFILLHVLLCVLWQ